MSDLTIHPVPEESSIKPPPNRRLNVALPVKSEAVLRRLSARTGYSIADLKDAIEKSRVFEDACENVLRNRYDAWKKSQDGEDIFGRTEKEE